MVRTGGVALLFVPADRPERYAKAAASGADAIIIDLEDAVASDRKDIARRSLAARNALPGDIPVFVRLNGLGTPWYEQDLACVAQLPISGVVLPKAESAGAIAALATTLGIRAVIALIETARGLAAAREIARDGRAVRLAFGSIDFCAQIGCAHTREALLCARSELVLASALSNLAPPIDGVTTVLDDGTASQADARHAVELGFGGKLCIHPSQVAAVRRGFAPTEEEMRWARAILATDVRGATAVGGAMVDTPVIEQARQILARDWSSEPGEPRA